MDIQKKDDYVFLDISRLLPWLSLLIFTGSLVLVVLVYRSYLMSFFIAGIVYVLFRNPNTYLLHKLNYRRSLTATISTIVVIVLVMLPLTAVLASLINELSMAVQHLRDFATRERMLKLYLENRWLDQYLNINENDLNTLNSNLIGFSTDLGMQTLKQGGNLLMLSMRWLANFFFSIIILFFFFRGGDRLGPVIYRNLPFPDEIEKEVGSKMVSVLDAVVKGNLMISVLQGLMIGLYFWFFGLPTPILYGTIGAFFGLIPIIGTAILWVPGSIWLYFQGEPTLAIILAILSFATYLILENLLKPIVLDKKLKLHPLFLFLAIVGGLAEFGIKGLILGPFFVTVFVSLWQILKIWNHKHGHLE